MPHLVLEFSDNILEKRDFSDLFQKCHVILSQTLPSDIEGCKSRAIEQKIYYIGNGSASHAFVHVSLKVMPGRSLDTLQQTGENLMKVFKNYFSESFKKFKLQLTLEITELEKIYLKIE